MSGVQRAQAQPERAATTQANAWGDRTDVGVQGGFGIQSGLIGSAEGAHMSSDLLQAQGFINRVESDGSTTYGAGASGKVAGVNAGYDQRGQGGFADFQADALGFEAYEQFNPEQGAGLGAGAYFAQAAVTAGDIGTDSNDSEARFGVGAGVGAGGRLHWADADGDGYREYGFGADIGPVSFDVRSEDPVQDLVPGARMVGNMLGYEGNMTEAVGNGLSTAASFVGGLFSGW